MERTKIDILISGGGIAGLTAAAAFGTAGFSVICVDPTAPVTERNTDGSDLRSTALLQPARDFLETAGIWAKLNPHASPLQTMRIVDAGGEVAEPRLTRDFDASDISDRPFGWNLPNWLLRREIVAHLATLPNVDFRPGVATAQLLTRAGEARVTLSDGSRIAAKLVIVNIVWVPVHLGWLWAGVAVGSLDLAPRTQRGINIAMAVSLMGVVGLSARTML